MSNIDIKQYFAEHEKKRDEVMAAYAADDWNIIKDEGDFKIYTRFVDGSSFSQIKSQITFPATIEALTNNLKTIPKVEEGNPQDGFACKYTFGETNDETDSKFYYCAVESGSRLVSNRDFICLRRTYKVGDKFVFVNASVPDEVKPVDKKYVRGKMIFQAYIAENDAEKPGNVKLTFIAHSDPCGSIPTMVYNVAITKQGYNCQKVAKAVQKA